MNSHLPLSIASPLFLRRYIEPPPRSTRCILFFLYNYLVLFFPITIHRFSRPVSVSPTHLRSTLPLCLPRSLVLPRSFLFFFLTFTPPSFSSLSSSYPPSSSHSCPPSPLCCVFSSFFSFITHPFPLGGRFCVGGSHLPLCHSPHKLHCVSPYRYIYICVCVCVCVAAKGKGESSL